MAAGFRGWGPLGWVGDKGEAAVDGLHGLFEAFEAGGGAVDWGAHFVFIVVVVVVVVGFGEVVYDYWGCSFEE